MTVKYSDLKNKRVFITGGGSGIGASIVQHFCEQKSQVFFVDINEEASNQIISECKKKNIPIPIFFKCDLINIKELQNTISKIIANYGPIDILINNAANDERHKIDDVTVEFWDNRMAINLRHYFFTVQAVKEGMIKNKGGVIINIGSGSWMVGEGGMAGYTAAKSGIVGLTRSFARDLGEYNIRVNSVVPGSIATERQIKKWLTPKYKKEIMDSQCLKRHLVPADVAKMVLFFSSDQSSGCTNQSYIVDAGWN